MPALSMPVMVMLVKNGFLHLYAELSDKALWTGSEPPCLLSGLYVLVMYACMSKNLFLKQDQFSSTNKVETGWPM